MNLDLQAASPATTQQRCVRGKKALVGGKPDIVLQLSPGDGMLIANQLSGDLQLYRGVSPMQNELHKVLSQADKDISGVAAANDWSWIIQSAAKRLCRSGFSSIHHFCISHV
jgi:hypothetical protein